VQEDHAEDGDTAQAIELGAIPEPNPLLQFCLDRP